MIIIEIQHSNDGATSVPPITIEEDKNTAEQTYHNKLAYAAVSSVYEHSVVMLNERGERVKGETYKHGDDNNAE